MTIAYFNVSCTFSQHHNCCGNSSSPSILVLAIYIVLTGCASPDTVTVDGSGLLCQGIPSHSSGQPSGAYNDVSNVKESNVFVSCLFVCCECIRWRLSQREPKLLKILAKILNRPIKITKPQPYGHFNRSIVDIWGCYRILFFLCSCVSLGTDGTFYPICLIYIFIDTEFMGTILTSVTKSGEW